MIKLKVFLLILIAELWGVAGQILYKKAVTKVGTPNLRDPNSYLIFFKKTMAMPAIWMGLGFIGIGLIAWLFALAQADLSIVYPVGSLQYILTLVGAHIFLDERINRMKTIGTLLVMAGILLVILS